MAESEAVETLITEEMRQQQGVWGEERTSYPVSASDIRKWAIAVYWPEEPPRLFWDEEYARNTRFGGIVAPEDFNPFAWEVGRGGLSGIGAQPGKTPKKGENVLNGGQQDAFFTRMRPGDVIRSRSRLTHWDERVGRNGLTLFAYTETEWHNQDGELVKRRISTAVRY